MSVKQIQERICVAKNEVLEAKLQEITKRENLDNYSLNMIGDSYEFGLIYAISGMVLGVVKVRERWCKLTKEKCHCECSEAILMV